MLDTKLQENVKHISNSHMNYLDQSEDLKGVSDLETSMD